MEWEIQKRSKACHACEREFREGDAYHCVLKYEKKDPVRRDFCEFCWQEAAEQEVENGDYISYWQSRVKPKLIQKKEDPIKRSVAEKLLRKYLHSSEPSHKNVCYVLALMLERKKDFIPRKPPDGEHDGKGLLVYEHAGTGETFLIADPDLSLAEVDKVQKQVQGILEMEQVGLEQ